MHSNPSPFEIGLVQTRLGKLKPGGETDSSAMREWLVTVSATHSTILLEIAVMSPDDTTTLPCLCRKGVAGGCEVMSSWIDTPIYQTDS